MTTDALFEAFQNPGPEWRGKPFWAWNGRLDKAELLRQVHVMKEMGLGGFFMHSRVGLATEYLGDDWFECINACADEAEKLGMEAWLYDEDRWPSGSAGGLVTANPDFRMRYLRCTVQTPGSPVLATLASEGTLARFACTLADDGLSYAGLRRLADGQSASPGEATLVFSVEEMAKSNFYNGYTYLDTMSRAATEAFLQSTHEKYVARCGDRLGKSIKGIFTDEPHRGSLMTSFGQGLGSSEWIVPWTPKMPEHWRAAHGDDLLDHLPEIFLFPDGQSVHPTKWRYVELCLTLFIENFCKPMDAWCREHNLILTGHFLHEDNLTSQVAMNGSMLRCYEHMEYPGMDLLTEGNKAFWVAKQLQSVGRQLGKPWLMSELYGCTGWQMDLEGHKHVGDWQALFGVNLRCHHLSWYTMEGEAKRDYPASILHQSAWWKDYSAVETYFARLGLLLSQGEPVCDVLVIHPVESVWAQIHPGWCNGLGPKAEGVKKLETQFAELFHWLQGAQIDFDYGDEGILAEHARVEGNDFVVGQMRYKTIVIGGCTTIRSSTLRLLEAFAAAGGKIIWAGEKPQFVDAMLPPAAETATPNNGGNPARFAFGEQLDWDQACVLEPLFDPESSVQFRGSTPEDTGVFCQRRRVGADSKFLLFVLNTDRQRRKTGTLRLPSLRGWKIEYWDCLEGQTGLGIDLGDAYYFPTSTHDVCLEPGQLGVWMLSPCADNDWEACFVNRGYFPKEELPGPFAYSLDEPNALVLDTATWDVVVPGVPEAEASGSTRQSLPSQAEAEILKIDQAVRRHFGLEVRGGEMVQPWYAEKFHGEPPVLGKLTLRFAFDVEVLPKGPLYLAMERPERFVVTVNGATPRVTSPQTPLPGARSSLGKGLSDEHYIPLREAGGGGEERAGGGWIDACFTLLDVPTDALQMGENTITLTTEFRRDSDLEAIYLLGDFGVRLDGPKRTVVALPETLAVGDICEQGLPFYTGCVTYQIPSPAALPLPAAGGGREGYERGEVERGGVRVELPEVGGACVRINGQTIPWPPYTTAFPPFAARNEREPEGVALSGAGGGGEGGGERCEPGDAGDAGEVGAEVTVVLTRRNLFGPLHLVPKQQVAYGPGHWTTEGAHWSDHYQLYPSGLLAPPLLKVIQ